MAQYHLELYDEYTTDTALGGFGWEDEDEARMKSVLLGEPVPSPNLEGVVYINGERCSEDDVELFDYADITFELQTV